MFHKLLFYMLYWQTNFMHINKLIRTSDTNPSKNIWGPLQHHARSQFASWDSTLGRLASIEWTVMTTGMTIGDPYGMVKLKMGPDWNHTATESNYGFHLQENCQRFDADFWDGAKLLFKLNCPKSVTCSCDKFMGGGNSTVFYFHPETWERWTHFDEHIFQLGWNHQLEFAPFVLEASL